MLQNVFRSNFAIIGLPLAQRLYGAEAATGAAVLSLFTIPLFNVLAVIALSVYGQAHKKGAWKRILLDVVKNPLIIGVLLGVAALLLRKAGVGFHLTDLPFLYDTLSMVARLASPFALIILGASFRFSSVKSLWKSIAAGELLRLIAAPLLGIGLALLLLPGVFDGADYATLVALFGTPVAVSSAIMANKMGGDGELAGQLVVWTTLFSGFTLFGFIVLLRSLGLL